MFPCSFCGLCCQNIAGVNELKKFDLGDGTCKFFNKITNQCNIYHDRPDICRIDKMFNIKYKKYFAKLEFYKLNAEVCNKLQSRYNLDISYRIKIGD